MKGIAPTPNLDIPDEAIAMNQGIDHQREADRWDEHGLLRNEAFRDLAFHTVKDALNLGQEVSMGITDLDRFKEVNDTYGHPAGDEVIDKTKGIFSEVAGESDTKVFVGRIGGDEFAWLIMGGDEEARKFAETLEAQYGKYLQEPENAKFKELGMDMSTGFDTLRPGMRGVSDLMHAADQKMYDRKVEKLGELKRRQKLGLLLAKGAIKLSNMGSRPKVRMRDAPKLWRKMGVLD